MIGFLIWSIVACFFLVLGIICICSKKDIPFGFWANSEMFKVKDVKAYNLALGKLWILFGIILELIGIPLLQGDNSPLIFITILGTVFLSIITMIIYMLVIEPKHKIK